MSVARSLGAQGKAARRDALTRLLVAVAAWTLAFALAALAFNAFFREGFAEFVSDATAVWYVVDVDAQIPDTWQVMHENGDGTMGVRDLSTYYAVRDAQVPLACAVYALGIAVIAVSSALRLVRQLDALTAAVSGLLANPGVDIELPDALAVARSELLGVRARSLADAHAAAEAERRKNELVAYLAHDIKSPLTAVEGYLSMLEEAPEMTDANRREYARIAGEKAVRLGGLVDDLFEVARYDLHAMELERESMDLGLFLMQVADELAPQAEARGLSIRVESPEGARLFADPGKLARALTNVVRNAVAYADGGTEVLVRGALREEEAADARSAVIAVEDVGREISPSHLRAVFDKFYREDGARSADRGGAGLGLAIAKEVVEAHGGTIAAASERGRTTFTIELPA